MKVPGKKTWQEPKMLRAGAGTVHADKGVQISSWIPAITSHPLLIRDLWMLQIVRNLLK